MGKVEECVERKLSEHGTPGQKPSEQDLAIKYQECRDDHPGGDSGFGEAFNGLPDQTFPPVEDEDDADFKFAGSNDDINGEIAQTMHENQFNQALMPSEENYIKMINSSKMLSQENKNSVLGMAYNYYEKIFKDDDVVKGNSFSNDVAQEMYETVLQIQSDLPTRNLTKEFLAVELTRRGFDAGMAHEFVETALEIESSLYPNVASIPQTEDTDLEVPNQNARTDFKPEDVMMGGYPREDLDADTITQDKKPNLGKKWIEDPNKERNQDRTEINIKNKKRSGNERLGHVANSTMARSPEADYPGMEQSLDQTIPMGQVYSKKN